MDEQRIPLCVPWFDEKEVFALNGRYDKAFGFYITADDSYDDFHSWLPIMYRQDERDYPFLKPEMLPVTSWEDNVRTRVKKEHWDKLRKYCYMAAGHRCEICGKKGEPYIECHELWTFDAASRTQKLKKLIALCTLCHKAHHLGYARRLGIYNDVLRHMMWVNDWSEKQLDAELDAAWKLWKERSGQQWKLDIEWIFSPDGYRYV
jgi:hypothetical protein